MMLHSIAPFYSAWIIVLIMVIFLLYTLQSETRLKSASNACVLFFFFSLGIIDYISYVIVEFVPLAIPFSVLVHHRFVCGWLMNATPLSAMRQRGKVRLILKRLILTDVGVCFFFYFGVVLLEFFFFSLLTIDFRQLYTFVWRHKYIYNVFATIAFIQF